MCQAESKWAAGICELHSWISDAVYVSPPWSRSSTQSYYYFSFGLSIPEGYLGEGIKCMWTYLRHSHDAWNIVSSQKWWLLLTLTGDTSKNIIMNFEIEMHQFFCIALLWHKLDTLSTNMHVQPSIYLILCQGYFRTNNTLQKLIKD